MPNTYAPEQFKLDIPKLNPWLSPEQSGTTYIGPNIDWENVPENVLSLLNLADPSGMMTMAPFGFISSPKGLGWPIKPKSGMASSADYIKNLPAAEKDKLYGHLEDIIKDKDISDVIKSEVRKYIPGIGKGAGSRKGGGMLDLLKDEKGLVGKDINKPLTRADIFRETPKLTSIEPEKPSYTGKSAKEILGSDLAAEITNNGYSPQIRAKILARYGTTPERHALVSKTAPQIEKIKEAAGPGSRGYVMGSFTSQKSNPSDIDLLVRMGTPKSTGGLVDLANNAYIDTNKALHPFLMGNLGSRVSPVSKLRLPSVTQLWRDETNKRYPGSQLIRLWQLGLIPAGAGIADYLNSQNTQ